MTRFERFAQQPDCCLAYRQVSSSFKSRLRDKIYASELFYPSNVLCQNSITIWSFNASGCCLSKNDQALVIKNDKNRHNFGLEELTRRKLILVLCLLFARKHRNLQINCISQLLIALSILSTLSPKSICQQFASQLVSFPVTVSFLHTRFPRSFFLHVSHLLHLQQLKCMYDSLLKAIQRNEALFASCVCGKDHFY